MPAPAATAAIVVVSLVAGAAVIATLKELVYEPHIAPAIERWAEEFLAKRRARQHRHSAVAVPSTNPMDTTALMQTYDQDEDEDRQAALELEAIVAREVEEWRNDVHRSRILPAPDEDGGVGTGGLRLRKKSRANLPKFGSASGIGTGTSLEEETIVSLPYTPLSPTHVIGNVSSNGAGTSTAHSLTVSDSVTASGTELSPNDTTSTDNPSNPFVDTDADGDGNTTSNRTSVALTDFSLMPYDSISNCFSPAPGLVPPIRPPTPPSAPAAPPARSAGGHPAAPPSEASTMRAPTIMSLQPISPPMSLDAIFSPGSGYGFNTIHPFSPPVEPLSPPLSPNVQITRSQSTETRTESMTQVASRPRPQAQEQSQVQAPRPVSRASSNASTYVTQRIPLSPPQGSLRSLSERFPPPSSPPIFVGPLDALSARSSSPASSFAMASPPPSARALSPPRDSRVQRVASQDHAALAVLSPLMGSNVGSLRTPPPISSGMRPQLPSASVKRATSGSGSDAGSGSGSRAAAPAPRARSGSVSSSQSSASVVQRIPMSPGKNASPALPSQLQLQQQQYQGYQNQQHQRYVSASASGMTRSSSRQSQSSSSGSVVQRLHSPGSNASRVTSPSRSSAGRTLSPFIDLSANNHSVQSLSSTSTRSRRADRSSSHTVSDADFLSVGSDSDDGVLSVFDRMSPARRSAGSGERVQQVLSPTLSPVRSRVGGGGRVTTASRSHRHAGSAFGVDDFSDGESADEWAEARRR